MKKVPRNETIHHIFFFFHIQAVKHLISPKVRIKYKSHRYKNRDEILTFGENKCFYCLDMIFFLL